MVSCCPLPDARVDQDPWEKLTRVAMDERQYPRNERTVFLPTSPTVFDQQTGM